jgi:hypothetical protein
MKKFIVAACTTALCLIVMDGTQIVKAPQGLIVKPGQALAADMGPPPPAPAPVGKGKAPVGGKGKAPIGKGKGKAPPPPVVTKG